MDLFPVIRQMPAVARISNFYLNGQQGLDLFFFVCPKMNGSGFRLNRNQTGFTTVYVSGLSQSAVERIDAAKRFSADLESLGVPHCLRCVFASADALILFPLAVEPAQSPGLEELELIANYDLVKSNWDQLLSYYNEKIWKSIKPGILTQEEERLRELIKGTVPENILRDFVERSWSGFALDGYLARIGCFGKNPVMLGLEGEGVAMLQNAGLPKEKWLPTIFLK